MTPESKRDATISVSANLLMLVVTFGAWLVDWRIGAAVTTGVVLQGAAQSAHAKWKERHATTEPATRTVPSDGKLHKCAELNFDNGRMVVCVGDAGLRADWHPTQGPPRTMHSYPWPFKPDSNRHIH